VQLFTHIYQLKLIPPTGYYFKVVCAKIANNMEKSDNLYRKKARQSPIPRKAPPGPSPVGRGEICTAICRRRPPPLT
ncbi:hypothetical protein, partial [Prevotella sp.]|uniref:hypothetical protein n=1 Tax=Prevotella sp. TaxID=59823 RepID=UPI003079E84A